MNWVTVTIQARVRVRVRVRSMVGIIRGGRDGIRIMVRVRARISLIKIYATIKKIVKLK